MKNTLYDYRNELETFSFDKKKVQGLVKRANKDGYNIYYSYHEDGQDTWRSSWSQNDYKENDSDVKLFEATQLIGKKKATIAFNRAATYTAECAIFVFAPLSDILNDPELRELKIQSVKNKAAKNATADYESAIKRKDAFDQWQNLPQENKNEITRLISENGAVLNQIGSKKIRTANNIRIHELGGECYPLVKWQIEASSFSTVEKYILFKQNKAVESLLKDAEMAEI